MNDENTLYCGDNLPILRRYIRDGSVDLVYLDPPFNSRQHYAVPASGDGTRAEAFKDTWRWDGEAARSFEAAVESGGRLAQVMQGLRLILGEGGMAAYLAMMAPRLVELRRVLKPEGSIYLHCDSTASHLLRLLMDAVFGADHFRNEIAWCYSIGGRSRKTFARKHDVIFWYSRGDRWTFNAHDPALRVPRKPGSHMKAVVDEGGHPWQEKTDRKTGRVYRYPLDKLPEDYWLGIEQLNRGDAERLGYPTQKPEALLERIVRASSSAGDLVLDPFCGCGTTLAAAERLGRHWIGIDRSPAALDLAAARLNRIAQHPVGVVTPD